MILSLRFIEYDGSRPQAGSIARRWQAELPAYSRVNCEGLS
jgi:hypothetical protein